MKRNLLICTTVVLLIACQAEMPSEVSNREAPAPSVDAPSASTAEPSSPSRDRAMEIEASRDSLRSEARSGSTPGGAVHAIRYYVGPSLVLVEEVIESPNLGRSESSYYFDDERLVYFRGVGTRTIYAADGTGVAEKYDIEIGFDGDGEVVDSKKIINGREATLEPFDWGAPKTKAKTLLAE